MNNPYVLGGSSNSQTKYFYALRRDDDGNLFIARVDTNTNEQIDVFGDFPPVEFDAEFVDFDFDEGRNADHTLRYDTSSVKYEQWYWDTTQKSYYLDDDGQLVLALNTNNKFNKVTDKINYNASVLPVTFGHVLYGNNYEIDAYQLLIDNGWNGVDPVVITNNGIIRSNFASIPAFSIKGIYPYGITVINNGKILGANGVAAADNSIANPGNAMFVASECTLVNFSEGTIQGGNSLTNNDDGYAIVGINNVSLTNIGTIGDTI